MTLPYSYVHCGLRLGSDIELHLPVATHGDHDVVVRWGADVLDSEAIPPGEVVAELVDEGQRLYTATETDEGIIVRFPQVGEFWIAPDFATVEARRDPTGKFVDRIPVMLEGTIPAMLHGLRGAATLHASAVAVDGRALAFVGQSGRGKSTLAAALSVLGGAALVTDDVLVVMPGDPPTCVGGAIEVRLRERAESIASEQPDLAVRRTEDSRTALAPAETITTPLPLAAIVVPVPSREATEITVTEVDPMKRLFALLAFPRVSGWMRTDVLGRDFATLGKIAESVPVYAVTIPWGPPFEASVIDDLMDLARAR